MVRAATEGFLAELSVVVRFSGRDSNLLAQPCNRAPGGWCARVLWTRMHTPP